MNDEINIYKMTEHINIRKETTADHQHTFILITKAFSALEFSDHKEQFLVERLRKSTAFIPELSLVAEIGNRIVGYILLTRICIKNGSKEWQSLALAPVAVDPDFQGRGIGGKLIMVAHSIAIELGHKSVILLGHAEYYPKFGYVPTVNFGISLPFEVPAENCMVVELVPNGLEGISGTVEYPHEFFE